MPKKNLYFRPYKTQNIPHAKRNRRDPTPLERKLWFEVLETLPQKFYWQRSIGNYIVDFYCPEAQLVLEVDGDSHFTPEGQLRDAERTAYLKAQGLRLLRFTNLEVAENIEGVYQQVAKALEG